MDPQTQRDNLTGNTINAIIKIIDEYAEKRNQFRIKWDNSRINSLNDLKWGYMALIKMKKIKFSTKIYPFGKRELTPSDNSYDPYYIDDELSNKIIIGDEYDSNAYQYIKRQLWLKKWYMSTNEIKYKLCREYCETTLATLGITVKSVKTFDNVDMSIQQCFGDCVFVFECEKNNYKFDARFSLDGDCYPGILLVKKMINTISNVKTRVHCDLRCAHTFRGMLANFMLFINSDDMDDYIEKRTGKYYELKQKLERDGINCYIHNIMKKNKLQSFEGMCGRDYRFFFLIPFDNVTLGFFPNFNREHNDYELLIYEFPGNYEVSQLEDSTMWEKSRRYRQKSETQRSFKYNSTEDYQLFVRFINNYIKYINDDYGVFDPHSNTTLNDRTISNNLQLMFPELDLPDPRQDLVIDRYVDLLDENINFMVNITYGLNYYYPESEHKRLVSTNVDFDNIDLNNMVAKTPRKSINDIGLDTHTYYVDGYNIRLQKLNKTDNWFLLKIESRGVDFLDIAKRVEYEYKDYDLRSPDKVQDRPKDVIPNDYPIGIYEYEGTIQECLEIINNIIKYYVNANDIK